MSASGQFLWHDYETFGTHPALDRPAQFASIRTDSDLNPVGEPSEWYCAPANDMLPHPVACLITGITPQEALKKGICEAEFARRIHAEMMEPNTCSVGYNSLKFDDEFSRNIFYRNFIDPYEREWRNGNSRFDLIGLARMCFALRPDGIEWPLNDLDKPSFRLEHLTAANNIGHEGAHDAVADVRATIDFARLIRTRQPKLFDWALGMRNQKSVMGMLNVLEPEPILHTSGRIPADRGCTSLYLPLAVFPDRPKSIIAVDLMANPEMLINGSPDEISDLVFTSAADLPDGLERVPLKAIHTNKVPMLAPPATLRGVDVKRISLNPDRCSKHARQIIPLLDSIRPKVMEVFNRPYSDAPDEPDMLLYGGDFFSPHDRSLMNKISHARPSEFDQLALPFKDPRLAEMFFRYRARNYPGTLSSAEQKTWDQGRRERLSTSPLHDRPGLNELKEEVAQIRAQPGHEGKTILILDQLDSWFQALGEGLELETETTT